MIVLGGKLRIRRIVSRIRFVIPGSLATDDPFSATSVGFVLAKYEQIITSELNNKEYLPRRLYTLFEHVEFDFVRNVGRSFKAAVNSPELFYLRILVDSL
uniref:Uncharacterized protein n=1 Tax=Romanomermis culicivorax TaxID=13658 RepID=A0A915KIT0_ROMCU